jgi:hypothetical protein
MKSILAPAAIVSPAHASAGVHAHALTMGQAADRPGIGATAVGRMFVTLQAAIQDEPVNSRTAAARYQGYPEHSGRQPCSFQRRGRAHRRILMGMCPVSTRVVPAVEENEMDPIRFLHAGAFVWRRVRRLIRSHPWLGRILHGGSADRQDWRSGDQVGGPANGPAMPRARSTLALWNPRRTAAGRSVTKVAGP